MFASDEKLVIGLKRIISFFPAGRISVARQPQRKTAIYAVIIASLQRKIKTLNVMDCIL
jgi:hypothetical protein